MLSPRLHALARELDVRFAITLNMTQFPLYKSWRSHRDAGRSERMTRSASATSTETD